MNEAHVAAQLDEARRSAERHGVELKREGNTASLRHLLGTPLLNLNSGVVNIRFALEALHPNWRNHIISVAEQMTLGDALDNMDYELQRVSTMLETDSTELKVERFPLTSLDLVDYAKGTKRRVQLDLNGGHKVELLLSADVKKHLDGKAFIQGNKALLDVAIDAIVDNIRRHAFAQLNEQHLIEFGLDLDLTDKKPHIIFSVANSGKPFPEGFDLERYVVKNLFAGKTGNTGLGGYHVNEVVRWHKGQLDLMTGTSYGGPHATKIIMNFPLDQ